MSDKPPPQIRVEAITHPDATRTNIPTAEYQSVMRQEEQDPVRVAYPRGPAPGADPLAGEKAARNRDLDPQLVWRGKDQQDWSELIVQAPPLYIQEKVHPKALIDDLRRVASGRWSVASGEVGTDHGSPTTGDLLQAQLDLFGDFNGIPEGVDKTDFYRHEGHWSNRMILGDSLQVMASLAEREGLRGKVQCIYLDPPYGIKFNSNFQWSTTSRDVKDGNAEHITREPEQVKAFRDTWRDGIHSYLTYLRDRLTVARDLLADSGSIFVQIGDENVHRVRALMDEVFGADNWVSEIVVKKTAGQDQESLNNVSDFILWFARSKPSLRFRRLYAQREFDNANPGPYGRVELPDVARTTVARAGNNVHLGRVFRWDNTSSSGHGGNTIFPFTWRGKVYLPSTNRHWSTHLAGLTRLDRANRIEGTENSLSYIRYFNDYPYSPIHSIWIDTSTGGFTDTKVYVVQTVSKIIERCILMSTDPGDLVLDPTCGSGTTAYVAEQWGRRWITIDTSRVALALARARIMGARYPYYLLADSPEGQLKEAQVSGAAPASQPTRGNVRHGFVYERVPHITLKSIANNAEIDVIWDKWQQTLEPLRAALDQALVGWAERGEAHRSCWEEWEVPREADPDWPDAAKRHHADWWRARIARQREIDASIAAKADFENLYDRPYEDKKTVRVAGPFTVESLSPHRVLALDENDDLVDPLAEPKAGYGEGRDFVAMILENLRTAGVQQAHKSDRIDFTALTPWPGDLVCAVGTYEALSDQWSVASGPKETALATDHKPPIAAKRAAIFIGPEFGTVARPDLVAAAREAGDAGFDVLIACAFNYDAHSSEFDKLGRIPVLKARMNADLHMADDLKNTGKGNLFVIFGEPDVTVISGRWLVARGGRLVANYEHVKELSGFGSLEEINGSGSDGLSVRRAVSAGGKVRPDESDQTVGDLSAGEHRGGGRALRDAGVSPVLGDRQRISGRDGDLHPPVGAAWNGGGRADGPLAGTDSRRWSDAQRTQALAAIQTLSPSDFPLSLTTDHWSQATVHGVDVFHPSTGEVRSDGPEGIACWFIDTDYDMEAFFVRHAYFLGANDPYKALRTTLKAEIDPDAWASLHSDTSRPFPKPASGRIAVKVINHLGDEVMKVFRVT